MKLLSALMLSTLAGFALADNRQGFYVGGGVGLAEFSDGSIFDENNSDRFNVVELLGGYKHSSALGLEVRVGTGVGERDATVAEGASSVDYDLSLEQYESIYYRPELANPEAKLYGLFGYTQVRRSSEIVGGATSDDTESGFSYGVGVGFVINPELNLNFEYKWLVDSGDLEIRNATIGLDYRF